jgi:hypothetical protein
MKVPTSTSFEARDFKRIERLALADQTTEAHIIRKAALAGLLELEREVLGEEFVGGVKRRMSKEVSA